MDFTTIIVGAGMSGITAAVELAEAGKEVVLVEKEAYLGGNASNLNNYFPKLCPPSCGLEINYRRIRSNPRISYYTGAEVTKVSGSLGSFSVDIKLSPRLINNNCTSCGLCADVCPEKAAYIPGGLAFPMKYCIDPEICKRQSCQKCEEVCQYDAIQLDAKPAEIQLSAGRVIVASGWKLYDADNLGDLGYKDETDVVTNLEFEKLLSKLSGENTKLAKPSDGTRPQKIAFVQCAGSRDLNHLPYCSSVCCSASLKHALTLAELYPEISTEIFYIDLRVAGRNEKLLRKAGASKTISLTKGKVGRIRRAAGGLLIEVEDIQAGTRRSEIFDMAVLATGLVPNSLSGNLSRNAAGFYNEQQIPGICVAGSCKRPMDVSSSVKDATAASLKSMQG